MKIKWDAIIPFNQKYEGVVHVWVLQVMHIPEICCQSIYVLQIIHTVKRGEHTRQGTGAEATASWGRCVNGHVFQQVPCYKWVIKKKMIWKHHFKVRKVHSDLWNDNETPIVEHNQSLKIPVLLYISAYCTIKT